MTNHCTRMKIAGICTTLILSASSVALAQQAASEPDPTVFQVQGGDTIQTAKLPDDIYLRNSNDPDDIIWNRIPVYKTFLTAAPPVHRSTELRFDPKLGVPLYFQLARTSERFYVRMRWQDSSRNLDSMISKFRDGAAIQMALNGVDTSYMMGTGPEKPVNIWYWRSDSEVVENLAAGGYGSTTLLPEQPVTGKAIYHSDQNPDVREWRVVMSREIASDGEHDIGLQDGTIPIAFALWQGEEGQRDGVKRVSHGWILANLAPATPASFPPSGSAQKPGVPVVIDDGTGPHPPEPATADPDELPSAGEFY